MSDENPLVKQSSLDDIAENCTLACLEHGANLYRNIISACFESKFQGMDECMNFIDSMIHADISHLTGAEQRAVLLTLNNIRIAFAHQRELIIKAYDK
jgi:hypothetical protein